MRKGVRATDSQAVVSGKSLRAVVSSLARTRSQRADVRSVVHSARAASSARYARGMRVRGRQAGQHLRLLPGRSTPLGRGGAGDAGVLVGNKPGNPRDVKVVESSLSSRLDQGAIEAVGAMVMTSKCRNERHRIRLTFQLEE